MTRRVVLMIDDEPDSFDRVCRHLDQDIYDLHHTHDPHKGINWAKDLKPDAIILDLRMEGLDGYDVCRRLRDHESTQEIPVIIYSVDGEKDPAIIRSLDLGAHAVVEKDRLSILEATLNRFIGYKLGSPVRKFHREGHELKIQGETERVWLDGEEKVLRPLEGKVLACLAAQPGIFISTEQLGEAIWGMNWKYMVKGNIHRLINSLRTKLVTTSGKRLFIDSRPRVGYRLHGKEEEK
ncbi:MAG: Transcriptional regulatory protein WalR [Anaerolineae bacterium]|nr:Transcriptional regulatory protein WalR [Anaerolineae bacterium]